MENLSSEQLTPNFTFLNSSVDFYGSFLTKYKNQRKVIYSNIYVATFKIMTKKTVHLEIISDLSTPAFTAPLKRFCAKRGEIHTIMSDNATKYKAAS